MRPNVIGALPGEAQRRCKVINRAEFRANTEIPAIDVPAFSNLGPGA
jgi:hypothetical protein